MSLLAIRDLAVSFTVEGREIKAVDGADLTVDKGETVALVGESGSGKSVTALSVLKLLPYPTASHPRGEIVFDGESLLDAPEPRMRVVRGNRISMIFQEPMTSLNPLQTIGRQISESVILHQNLNKREALERAEEMLRRVHISDPARRVQQYPHELSGGMRQRVMIALGLSCNPSILIADEPTTALDVTVQAQILDLMRELQEEFDSAIMLITHNLGVVSQTADHVAVMYLGKVVEFSDVRSIFHNPKHPYTIGLLNSIPVLGQKDRKNLVPIEGMVPSPSEDIKGCAFADRCPRVMDVCRQEIPPFRAHEPGHSVACWLYE